MQKAQTDVAAAERATVPLYIVSKSVLYTQYSVKKCLVHFIKRLTRSPCFSRSEGFVVARALANKFVCLYMLCRELLSKQMHYDWGLRAVKSLLRQAGKLKRGDPDMDEYPILMRALRDFNTPKITTDDMPIFLRLVMDLFPGVVAETKSRRARAVAY